MLCCRELIQIIKEKDSFIRCADDFDFVFVSDRILRTRSKDSPIVTKITYCPLSGKRILLGWKEEYVERLRSLELFTNPSKNFPYGITEKCKNDFVTEMKKEDSLREREPVQRLLCLQEKIDKENLQELIDRTNTRIQKNVKQVNELFKPVQRHWQ